METLIRSIKGRQQRRALPPSGALSKELVRDLGRVLARHNERKLTAAQKHSALPKEAP